VLTNGECKEVVVSHIVKPSLLIVAIALAVLAAPQGAGAAGPGRVSAHSTVRSAGAEFDSYSGCVQTHVDVQGQQVLTDTTVVDFGSVSVQHLVDPNGFLRIRQTACDGAVVLDASGPPCCDAPPPPLEGLTIARDLTSASLVTTFTTHDSVSDSDIDFAVDLSWTAIPPLTRGHFKVNDTANQVNVNDVGTGYGASVSGSVSHGADVYGPDVLDNAFISKDVSHFLNVGF
jgi:hypothetical protein